LGHSLYVQVGIAEVLHDESAAVHDARGFVTPLCIGTGEGIEKITDIGKHEAAYQSFDLAGAMTGVDDIVKPGREFARLLHGQLGHFGNERGVVRTLNRHMGMHGLFVVADHDVTERVGGRSSAFLVGHTAWHEQESPASGPDRFAGEAHNGLPPDLDEEFRVKMEVSAPGGATQLQVVCFDGGDLGSAGLMEKIKELPAFGCCRDQHIRYVLLFEVLYQDKALMSNVWEA
jgi:hypothetical protein